MTNDNERIDDLQRNGYRIIQNKDCFCFGMDAVLLSSFAKAQKNEQVLDLGTGNGVIPILMQAKNPEIISTFVMIIFLSAFTASSNLFLIFYYTNAVNSPVPADKYKILIKYSPKYTESCETIHHLNVLQLPPCLLSAPFHTDVLRSCILKAGL